MHWRHLRLAALVLGGVVAVLVGAAVVERLVGYGKVLPGVEVRGGGLSGTSTDDARAELEALAPELERTPWVGRSGDRELVLDPRAIGYEVDVDTTVDDARRAGRSRNPVEQVVGTLARLVRPDEVPLAAGWDEQRFEEVLDTWSDALSEGLRNGGLAFEGATVIEIEPEAGVGLLRDQAVADLDVQLHSTARDEVPLEIGFTEPEVDAEEVARAAAEARAILAEPVVLRVGTDQITIDPADLGPCMHARARGSELVLGIDADELHARLAADLAPFEAEPVDAGFEVEGDSVRVIPAVVGRTVELHDAAESILAGNHLVDAELVDIAPVRTTEWAESLNITELVSTFTTSYPPGQPRVRNIQRAAELVNGTIVEPGATFSLNETIGPRTPERGFVEAPGFSEADGFFDTYGGGVSQLSTTLYNATFFGGYEIVEHTPHSIYISRYPMGREATLDYPGLDNVFRNDSESGILVQAWAGASSVTISYYGNREGRVVEAEGPNVIDEIPVAEELVETDLLPEGERLPVAGEGGFPGLVVEYFRIIHRPGEPEERQRFTWTYDMRPRQIFVGTGPRPPEEGEEPPPGEPPPGMAPPEEGAPPPPPAAPASLVRTP